MSCGQAGPARIWEVAVKLASSTADRNVARALRATALTVTPAVTCTVQAPFMTGGLSLDHGAVANG